MRPILGRPEPSVIFGTFLAKVEIEYRCTSGCLGRARTLCRYRLDHGLVIPEKDPPPPAAQHLQVLFINVVLACLDLGAESLQPLGDGPGHSERHFIGEDIQNRKDKECDGSKSPFAGQGVPDTGDQGFALAEGVFGVVGRLRVFGRPPEYGSDSGNAGSTRE